MIVEGLCLLISTNRRDGPNATAYNERCLCKSVAWIECFFAKAARPEHRSKTLQRFFTDGFSAVEGHSPTAQVECRALFRFDFSQTNIVRETWAAACRRLIS